MFPISVPERLHSWKQGSPGVLQDEQQEGLRFRPVTLGSEMHFRI